MKIIIKYKMGIAIVLILIFTLPWVYAYFWRFDVGFWKNMVGNLLATTVALMVGVPIGLWVDRSIKSVQQESEQILNKERELRLLRLIKIELRYCFDNIFLPSRKNQYNSYLAIPYKTDTWDTLGVSGEIKYVSSLELLDEIAWAYYYIKAEGRIEYDAQVAATAGRIAEAKNLIGSARNLDIQLENGVNKALQNIEAMLI